MAKVPHWMKRRNLVQQMLQLGVPTEVTQTDLIRHDSQSILRIEFIGGVSETSAFDLDLDGTGYMVSLCLTVLREPFAIAAFDLAVPWMRGPVIWLSDPNEGNGPNNTYQFPGRYPLEYPRGSVINHLADVRRNLPLGKSITACCSGTDSTQFRIVFNTAVRSRGC